MKTPTPSPLSTRDLLLDAAEQLFASKGIDNVSLVDIGRAAGQKNRNALQYHFGSKEKLIHAVLDRHTQAIGSDRQRRLNNLDEKRYGLRELVEIFVRPVADKQGNRDSGKAFIHINAQLAVSQTYATMRRDRVLNMPEVQHMNKLLAAIIPTTEAWELEARMLLADCMLFSGLASYLSLKPISSREQFINVLIDSICALLSAPGSTLRQ